jgi:outer membrane immunogenic protein
MLRLLSIGAVTSLTFLSSAYAADLYRAPEPRAGYKDGYSPDLSWAGFYAGVNGGYGWVNQDTQNIQVFNPGGTLYASGPLRYDLKSEGGFGGGQVGWNYQLNKVVVGIEADLEAAGIKGNSSTNFAPPVIAKFDYAASKDLDWFGTVRARLGLAALDRALVYATGGFAFGHVSYNAHYIFTDTTCCIGSYGLANAHENATGYTVGGGVEYQLAANWSLKAEYQYLDLGSHDVAGRLYFANGTASGEVFKTRYDEKLQTVRAGLNYHVGSVYEPLK